MVFKSTPYYKNLPLFIKVYCIYFFIGGVIIFGLALYEIFSTDEIKISIYGLSAIDQYSKVKLIIQTLYLIKFINVLGFYYGKKWSKQLGIFDAILGILICLFVITEPLFMKTLVVPNRLPFDIIFVIWFLYILLSRRIDQVYFKQKALNN